MAENFYTNVQAIGNEILFRGVMDGKKVKTRIKYNPSFYEITNKESEYKTLEGKSLKKITFDGLKEARDYYKKYEDVSNKMIFGNTRFEYAFIADEYKGQISWDKDKVTVGLIDIEVGSENGFPDPYEANEPITAITIQFLNGDCFVFGCGDYQIQGNEKYIKCQDEWTLCKKFLDLWNLQLPDVITGWNIKFFDIPYLINRFNKILGESESKKLSPWKLISERNVNINGNVLKAYELVGVSCLDYLELYKWYAPQGKSQESYKLDNIAFVELKERKISYDEYQNLHQLYRLNFQKFIEYNIRDVELILRLEEKMRLIEMALTLAYDTRSNYEDVFAQTRMWDSMTYSYLLERSIIVPPRIIKEKDAAFEGAYVKEPQIGMHRCIASFDLDSLYPHLQMMYNISPETLVEPENYTPGMRKILSQGVTVDKMLRKEIDLSILEPGFTMTPNGQFFRTDIEGFLPKMLREMYEDRKKFKKLMLKYKQQKENETDPKKIEELEKLISTYNNIQLAKKVSLNSAYGALGSQYFRFYDLRLALSVTIAGQLSIRWIENKLNEFMNKILKREGEDFVIASDTDSIYLRLSGIVDAVFKDQSDIHKIINFMDKVCEEKIQPYINKSYQELADYVHAYEQKMRMKREALSNKGIWTAKKRYILNVYNNEGVAYKEPDLKVMGLEMVKSSTPSVIREKMKETIQIIMNKEESDVQDYIFKLRNQFRTYEIEDISFPKGVNGLSKYSDNYQLYQKGTPIHVKGALLYNKLIKEKGLEKQYEFIKEGEKIKFAYLKLPNPLKDKVIAFSTVFPKEFGLDKYIDYDVQFEKTYLDPVKVILDCIGWKVEKTNSLDDFFI